MRCVGRDISDAVFASSSSDRKKSIYHEVGRISYRVRAYADVALLYHFRCRLDILSHLQP